MAADPNKLTQYISQELVNTFKLGSSNESIEKFAAALSRSVVKFLKEDVEVKAGQQIVGQGTGEVDVGGSPETVNTEVSGKTTTKGKLL